MRRYSAARLFAIAALCALFSACNGPSAPSHTDAWLSYKYGFTCGTYFNNPADLNGASSQQSATCPGMSNFVEAGNYYNDIGAPATFDDWKMAYGFLPPTGLNAEAFYGNVNDLQFGRDMNCSQTGTQIACYVTNYGPQAADCTASGASNCPWPNLETGVNDAIAQQSAFTAHGPFATVAMVYNGTPNTPTNPQPVNNITFYVYNGAGNMLLPFAALDNEGAKSVPQMCMACHGGDYTAHTSTTPASVKGTSFLPFDVLSFYYSKANPGKGVDQQQEQMRILNLLVKTVNGGDQPIASQTPQQTAIIDFINGQYCPDGVNGGVQSPYSSCPAPVEKANSQAIGGYFPAGWLGYPAQKAYSEVMKPYCRMCHMAQSQTFFSASALGDPLLKPFVCTSKDMPHAEVPFGGGSNASVNPFVQQNDTSHFWLDGGVALGDLAKAAGFGGC
jgi:hypothetical protein